VIREKNELPWTEYIRQRYSSWCFSRGMAV